MRLDENKSLADQSDSFCCHDVSSLRAKVVPSIKHLHSSFPPALGADYLTETYMMHEHVDPGQSRPFGRCDD